jgi:hypothetical protein
MVFPHTFSISTEIKPVDEEFSSLLRELRRIGVRMPDDVTRESFAHDLGVVLEQLNYMRHQGDESDLPEAIHRAMQFSAELDESDAQAFVDRCEAYRRNQALPCPFEPET